MSSVLDRPKPPRLEGAALVDAYESYFSAVYEGCTNPTTDGNIAKVFSAGGRIEDGLGPFVSSGTKAATAYQGYYFAVNGILGELESANEVRKLRAAAVAEVILAPAKAFCFAPIEVEDRTSVVEAARLFDLNATDIVKAIKEGKEELLRNENRTLLHYGLDVRGVELRAKKAIASLGVKARRWYGIKK